MLTDWCAFTNQVPCHKTCLTLCCCLCVGLVAIHRHIPIIDVWTIADKCVWRLDEFVVHWLWWQVLHSKCGLHFVILLAALPPARWNTHRRRNIIEWLLCCISSFPSCAKKRRRLIESSWHETHRWNTPHVQNAHWALGRGPYPLWLNICASKAINRWSIGNTHICILIYTYTYIYLLKCNG